MKILLSVLCVITFLAGVGTKLIIRSQIKPPKEHKVCVVLVTRMVCIYAAEAVDSIIKVRGDTTERTLFLKAHTEDNVPLAIPYIERNTIFKEVIVSGVGWTTFMGPATAEDSALFHLSGTGGIKP